MNAKEKEILIKEKLSFVESLIRNANEGNLETIKEIALEWLRETKKLV